MYKKLLAILMIFMLAVGFSSCKVGNDKKSGVNSNTTTQRITRIYNSYKDVLPEFRFESEPVETYEEGVSYSFSAECSEKDFDKYVDKVKKSGFDIKPAEGKGYYKAQNAERYFVEIVLVNGIITVYVKR